MLRDSIHDRGAGTKTMSDTQAKLEDMSLAECIAAVAEDVASKRDEYRSIDPHELAGLLGIDDADKPGGDWNFVRYVTPTPLEDIFDWGNEQDALELLHPHLTAERYEELKSKIELATGTRTRLRPESLDFLTEVEKQTIVRLHMEREAKDIGASRVNAYYYTDAPQGGTLTFEALIEDDGGCVDLKTPYDERDGKFTDFSDCLTHYCPVKRER
jgi:hypothetical protein